MKKKVRQVIISAVIIFLCIFTLSFNVYSKELSWSWVFRERRHSVVINISESTYEEFVKKPRCSYICELQSAIQSEPVIANIANQLKEKAEENGYDNSPKVFAEFIASFGQSIAQRTYYNYLNANHVDWYPLYATQLLGRLLFAKNGTGLCADFSILTDALLFLNGIHRSGLVEIDSKDHMAIVVDLPGVVCHGAYINGRIWCFIDSTGLDNFDLYNGAPPGTPVKVYLPFKKDIGQ
jgi:hypothetical protein